MTKFIYTNYISIAIWVAFIKLLLNVLLVLYITAYTYIRERSITENIYLIIRNYGELLIKISLLYLIIITLLHFTYIEGSNMFSLSSIFVIPKFIKDIVYSIDNRFSMNTPKNTLRREKVGEFLQEELELSNPSRMNNLMSDTSSNKENISPISDRLILEDLPEFKERLENNNYWDNPFVIPVTNDASEDLLPFDNGSLDSIIEDTTSPLTEENVSNNLLVDNIERLDSASICSLVKESDLSTIRFNQSLFTDPLNISKKINDEVLYLEKVDSKILKWLEENHLIYQQENEDLLHSVINNLRYDWSDWIDSISPVIERYFAKHSRTTEGLETIWNNSESSNSILTEDLLSDSNIDELGILLLIMSPITKKFKIKYKIYNILKYIKSNFLKIIKMWFLLLIIILSMYISVENGDFNQSLLLFFTFKGFKEISKDIGFKIFSCVCDCYYEPESEDNTSTHLDRIPNRPNSTGTSTLLKNSSDFDREEEAYYNRLENNYRNRPNWGDVLNNTIDNPRSPELSFIPFLMLPQSLIHSKVFNIIKRIILSISLRFIFGYLMTFISPWITLLAFIDITFITGLLPSWVIGRVLMSSSIIKLENSPSSSSSSKTLVIDKDLPHRPISNCVVEGRKKNVLPQLPIERYPNPKKGALLAVQTIDTPTQSIIEQPNNRLEVDKPASRYRNYNSAQLEKNFNKTDKLINTRSRLIQNRLESDGTNFISGKYEGQTLPFEQKRVLALRKKGMTESQIFWDSKKRIYSGIPLETVKSTELPKPLGWWEERKLRYHNERIFLLQQEQKARIAEIAKLRREANLTFNKDEWIDDQPTKTTYNKFKGLIKKVFKR